MRHTAEVFLWGSRIGVVTQGNNDLAATFEYDRAFQESGIELSPLRMPLSDRLFRFPTLNPESFRGLPGLLADSLPDDFGNAVIDCWLASHGRNSESFTAIERLCYTGVRGMGALEYYPAEGPEASRSEQINVGRLVELAEDVLLKRESALLTENNVDYQGLLQFGTSAGGARAKAVVAWNRETGEIRSGQTAHEPGFSQWVMKLDGVGKNGDHGEPDTSDYTRVEYAYYLMAREAGIQMMPCRLYEEHGRHHFMTKRFDRQEESGAKLHMQTLAGLAHYDYKQPRAYSYEQAAACCLQLRLPANQLGELYRRMVFNILATNCDDHVKNCSFLMDRHGIWALSPAYDLTFSYKPSSPWVSQHQLSVNGKYQGITKEDLLKAAGAMNLTQAQAKKIISQVQEAVVRWPEFAQQAHITEVRTRQLQKFFPQI